MSHSVSDDAARAGDNAEPLPGLAPHEQRASAVTVELRRAREEICSLRGDAAAHRIRLAQLLGENQRLAKALDQAESRSAAAEGRAERLERLVLEGTNPASASEAQGSPPLKPPASMLGRLARKIRGADRDPT